MPNDIAGAIGKGLLGFTGAYNETMQQAKDRALKERYYGMMEQELANKISMQQQERADKLQGIEAFRNIAAKYGIEPAIALMGPEMAKTFLTLAGNAETNKVISPMMGFKTPLNPYVDSNAVSGIWGEKETSNRSAANRGHETALENLRQRNRLEELWAQSQARMEETDYRDTLEREAEAEAAEKGGQVFYDDLNQPYYLPNSKLPREGGALTTNDGKPLTGSKPTAEKDQSLAYARLAMEYLKQANNLKAGFNDLTTGEQELLKPEIETAIANAKYWDDKAKSGGSSQPAPKPAPEETTKTDVVPEFKSWRDAVAYYQKKENLTYGAAYNKVKKLVEEGKL